ncbi:MAG: Rne/Rng family ribonuclease [Bacteroidia bacterium]|nr:Rne/Rng family ribonuclease [Bacteroidia bacterium]MDW8235923.1 Rne/Rng family ribonuclease [Bacteroidia bacterium]
MREAVILYEGDALDAYVFEHRQLVEYYHLASANSGTGGIFLGEVSRVVEGLNAAFVSLGLSKEGFLHISDALPGLLVQKPFLEALRRGHPFPEPSPPPASMPAHLKDILRPGDWVLVQVIREMTDSKGPRLTTQISFPGQTLVLLPLSYEVGISHRIIDPILRHQWKQQLLSIFHPPYGIILRTQGQTLPLSEIEHEYHHLIYQWEKLVQSLEGRSPPFLLAEQDDPFPQLMPELLRLAPQHIHIIHPHLHHRIQAYLQTHPMPSPPVVRLHRRREHIESLFALQQNIRLCLGRTITLQNGGYIVIEHTEALHVIDVNTGSQSAQNRSPDELILQTNLLAAQEIARQIRLRDLGGIIIVDFIDMRKAEHRQLVWERLREAMRADRAKHGILPMSEYGIVQITRQRRRHVPRPIDHQVCPACRGAGVVYDPSESLTRMYQQLSYWLRQYPRIPLLLQLHPLLAALWRRQFLCVGLWLWYAPMHRWILIQEEEIYPFIQGRLFRLGDKRPIALLE